MILLERINSTIDVFLGCPVCMLVQPSAEADYFSQRTLSTTLGTDEYIDLLEINVNFFYRAHIPYN